MSSDRPQRPAPPRYSRFSQVDVVPPRPPEEPSLAEIAARALNAQHLDAPRRPLPDNGWRNQPPPPEPSPFWEEQRWPLRSPPPPPMAPAAEAREPVRNRQTPAEPQMEQPAQPRPAKARRPQAKPVPAGPGILARTMTAARQKAAPALIDGAFWLARNLRRREIRKRYNRALVFGHTRIADRKLEKLFFVPTLKSQAIGPAPDRGVHYDGPVPAAVFDWVMAAMPADLRQFAFIDMRAGRGRATLLAAKRNFNRIVAYEYDPELFDDLTMNVAQYPRSLMACRNIDCRRADIDGIRLPDQPCVIYFSGSWREQMIPGVMDYVRQTYRQSPRRLYVVLENVCDETGLAGDNIFERLEPALGDRLKLRLLSPMDFRLYRSSV
ncbi:MULTISPECIES: hypothetical protein [Rhodomicrobium]|uniref:hypothetical protein n=1 Tax=Rhodomicrobium TaxID=1068 RepID=UPI000F7436EF|nr:MULTISPECIES: hypothetical protein [Rhodomicrobium]